MSLEMMQNLEVVLYILLAVLVAAALVCQVLAMRHRTEDALKYMHKDSLFKNKELVYNETGMRYIRAQKKIAIAVMLVALGFVALYSNMPQAM